jgi:hypothetical protein
VAISIATQLRGVKNLLAHPAALMILILLSVSTSTKPESRFVDRSWIVGERNRKRNLNQQFIRHVLFRAPIFLLWPNASRLMPI